MGREHAMKANEMEPGPGNKGGQALQEFQGCHDDMRGPIAVRRFELKHHLACERNAVGAGRCLQRRQGRIAIIGVA